MQQLPDTIIDVEIVVRQKQSGWRTSAYTMQLSNTNVTFRNCATSDQISNYHRKELVQDGLERTDHDP